MAQCGLWKLRKFILTHFCQKFRESNGFTKEITKELIWRNSFMRMNSSFFQSMEITEFYCHHAFFSQKFRDINLLLKNFTLNWFDDSEFLVFNTVSYSVKITQFYCHHFVAKIPSKHLFTKELHYELIWRKIFCMALNISFLHTVCLQRVTVCGKNQKWSHLKKFREINMNVQCLTSSQTNFT